MGAGMRLADKSWAKEAPPRDHAAAGGCPPHPGGGGSIAGAATSVRPSALAGGGLSVASKDLLELEQKKPSFLESNFLLHGKEKDECEAVRPKTKKKKKRDEVLGKEESKRHTTATVPTSQVLGKVKDFLGVIAEANEKLLQSIQGTGRSEHDIEVLSGSETEYIQMDLLLGITDLQTPEAVEVAEAAVGGSRQYLPLLDGNSSSDSEEDGDENTDHIAVDTGLSPNEAPKPKVEESSRHIQSRKRLKITVLN